jgi:hypothetical protein
MHLAIPDKLYCPVGGVRWFLVVIVLLIVDLIEHALELGLLHIGQKTIIPYEEYATLFTAVDPDQVSPADSYHFAKANNCHDGQLAPAARYLS